MQTLFVQSNVKGLIHLKLKVTTVRRIANVKLQEHFTAPKGYLPVLLRISVCVYCRLCHQHNTSSVLPVVNTHPDMTDMGELRVTHRFVSH